MKKRLYIFLLAAAGTIATHRVQAQSPITVQPSTTQHGPENGSLIIIGGNVGSQRDIWDKFTELAGGKDKAKIVVVTAATPGSAKERQAFVETVKKESGVKNVVELTIDTHEDANNLRLLSSLKDATGVYFEGGRQWRIADLYLNTLTHQAFLDVLKRGGVIAGSSAGASIQGSFLWRGDTKDNYTLIGDHTQGLGFLKNAAIDQHVLVRNRPFDLVKLIRIAPKLIGIGLDEATAVVVQKDTLEVIGKSYVEIYDYNTIKKSDSIAVDTHREYAESGGPFFFLSKGQRYDLKNRKVLVDNRKKKGAASNTPESNSQQ